MYKYGFPSCSIIFHSSIHVFKCSEEFDSSGFHHYLVRTLLHVFWYYYITLLQIHYHIEQFTILIKTPFRISFIDCKLCSKICHQNHNCVCISQCKLVIVCVNQSKNDKQDTMINKKFSEYRYLGKVRIFYYNCFFSEIIQIL